MKVHCITTGVARPKRAQRGLRRYLVDEWSDESLPVHAFLLEHSDGLCLFDAGQTADATLPGHLPRWHPFLRLSRFELTAEDEVAPQMRRLGFAPGDVRWVVLSHMHTDHVGGIRPFTEATIVVTRREWKRATGLGGRLRGYLPQHWPAELDPHLIDFDGAPFGPFAASHDLSGDGSLLLVPTPGHTPGHMALLARDRDRAFMCCGDLVHEAAELAAVAPEIDRFCRESGFLPLATHDRGVSAALV